MAPSHHPSGQALANFLAGDCSPGAALLINRHVARCPRCAGQVKAMGSVGVEAGVISCGETETVRPGLEITRVRGASGLGEAVFCIRAAPAQRIPLDERFRVVEILVLEGGFTADGDTYFPDDFLSLEETPKTQLISKLAEGCLCLVATDAPAS